MNPVTDNFALFLEQQIELYGDDICLPEMPDIKTDKNAQPVSQKAAHSTSKAQPAFGPQANEADWQQTFSLDELNAAINTCQKCALGHTRNRFVFGSGHPNADVMFIGEAPGADEDRIGEPFVGAAGELLTKILAAINFKREDVYICNILKCRPPQNRDPLPDEVALCKPYLFKQIELIQPKIICCLGRVAAQVLLQTTDSLSRLRGQWIPFHGAQLMVTYHPAALLRNPEYKRPTWDDVQRLQKLYVEVKES
jgi:DNA polymerase